MNDLHLPLRFTALLLAVASTNSQSMIEPEVRTLGNGSPGALGIPQLAMFGSPVLGNPFALYVENVVPGSVGSMFVSTQELPIPLAVFGVVTYPGLPLIALPFVADADGCSPHFVEQLPTPASLVGARIVSQALVLDAAAQSGVAFTAAAHIRVGEQTSGKIFERPWPLTLYPTGHIRQSLRLADFDEDGRLDLVSGGYPSLLVSLTAAGPNFTPVAGPLTGGLNWAVVPMDFDGDGHIDLITTVDPATDDLLFIRGVGDGSFETPVPIPTLPNSTSVSVSVGDWSNDGMLDLLTAEYTTHQFVLLKGAGNGQFALHSVIDPPAMFSGPARASLVQDLNADGIADLILAWQFDVGVQLGLGNNTFGPLLPIAASGETGNVGCYGMHLADFDNDGLLDLVMGGQVLRGIGDGTFAAWQTLSGGTSCGIDVVDFDHDGDLDLGISLGSFRGKLSYSGRAQLFRNDGTGLLQPFPRTYPSSGFQFADLDLDGNFDLVIDREVIRGIGNWNFEEVTQYPRPPLLTPGPIDLDVGDLNDDGLLDTVLVGGATSATPKLFVLHRDRTGQKLVQTVPIEPTPRTMLLTHLDQDGALDVVIPSRTTGTVQIGYGDGNGMFLPLQSIPAGAGAYEAQDADLNGDGVTDLVVTNFAEDTVSVLFGRATGGFAPAQFHPVLDGPQSLALQDLDADGELDLVITFTHSDEIGYALNLGGGTFGPVVSVLASSNPGDVAAGDLDGDGFPELIVTSQADEHVVVLRSNGPLVWQAPIAHAIVAPRRLELADLNGDGRTDIAVGSGYGLFVLETLASGDSDTPRRESGAGAGFALVDWSGDLVPDLISSDATSVPNQLLE